MRGKALLWFEHSCIAKFKEKVNNCLSECLEISLQVPQCGVLWPTLFTIYINDVSLHSKIFAFEDVTFNKTICDLKVLYHLVTTNKVIVKTKSQMLIVFSFETDISGNEYFDWFRFNVCHSSIVKK